MVAPLVMAAIMAAAGLLKSELSDRPKEKRQRKLAAETIRWRPFTGLQPGEVQEADPFGSALQGGFSGYGMGQQQEAAGRHDKLLEGLLGQKQAPAASMYDAPAQSLDDIQEAAAMNQTNIAGRYGPYRMIG